MANLWVQNREQVRNALLVAKQAKALCQMIQRMDDSYAVLLAEKWEHDADGIITDFEFFLANSERAPTAYRYQAYIDVPQCHMNQIKYSMQRDCNIDIEPLLAQITIDDVPQEVVEEVQVQEPVQATLF